MNVTRSGLLRAAGLAAVVAGLLFVVIQPVHPHDTLESVTTNTWALVHYATLVMTILFIVGIGGIYLRQVEETGWLGLNGFVILALALLITAAFVFLEAFIEPLLAATEPEFVESLLGVVGGTGATVDLGPLPMLWSVSGVLFPLGCLVFGIAVMRAGILSRWASGVFAFGLPVAIAVVSMLPQDLHRVGAIPVGIGLAWLGYSLWSERPVPATEQPLHRTGSVRPDPSPASQA